MNKKIVLCISCILVLLGVWGHIACNNQPEPQAEQDIQFHVACDSIPYTNDDIWDACWVLSSKVTMLHTDDIERGRICKAVYDTREFHEDPYLVFAMIFVESSFRPNIVNKSSGAMGLMQILPSTLNYIKANILTNGGPFAAGDTLFIPTNQTALKIKWNIYYGTAYLKYLLKKYGNLEEALSHYGGYVGRLYSPYSKKVLLKREEYLKEFSIGRMEQFKKETAQEKIIT